MTYVRSFWAVLLALLLTQTFGQTTTPALLTRLPAYQPTVAKTDWLLQTPTIKASVARLGDRQVVLSNGLISRTFYLMPNAATIGLKNLVTGEEFIRAVQPEAWVTIDGQPYAIGGLAGQVDKGYLLEAWLPNMTTHPGSFVLSDMSVRDISAVPYSSKRWLPTAQWKAAGKELTLSFTHPTRPGITVQVHHTLYDGIPLLSKRISVINQSGVPITLDRFTSELIAFPEQQNFVSTPDREAWRKPNLYLENEYAFDGMSYDETNKSIRWTTDSSYTSQVNYDLQTPCLVRSEPKIGPSQIITPGSTWESFRTYVMPLDGSDRERNTLSQRKMYRMLAPWATENPIFMHLTSTDPAVMRTAIDQCVATGYEMVILSFGSGLNMEDQSAANLKKFKDITDYAHSKGIELGGYSLFSSRTIDPENDVINVKTGKPGGARFNNAPCLSSQWGIDYLKKLQHFFEVTGFDLLEHDGPYPGDLCASTTHPGHAGYADSQWNQWKQSVDFYRWLRQRNVYINAPDFYILSGTNKSGIGYREVNWSLPRAQQLVLGRQNIYDGTWARTPSMGWTFVPLVEYHGGGKAATLEPLSDHLDAYGAHMEQNYGAGVQACYRGNRLYDTDATKALVQQKIAHYKKYRDILNADIIHLRRPTGRDWDGFMHVEPRLKQKAYVLLFNPLQQPLKTTVSLPLYYTGIRKSARIRVQENAATTYALDPKQNVSVPVTIPANGSIWLTVEDNS